MEHLFTSIKNPPTVHEEFPETDTNHRWCHENEEVTMISIKRYDNI
jgi:hypothetical protein